MLNDSLHTPRRCRIPPVIRMHYLHKCDVTWLRCDRKEVTPRTRRDFESTFNIRNSYPMPCKYLIQ